MSTSRLAISQSRRRITGLARLAGMLAVPTGATSVAAAAIATVGGFDYYAGASGQTTNGVLGAGGLGVPVSPSMMLRVTGTRFIGDEDLRAWRAKVGPQFSLPGGGALTLSYSHYRNHLGTRSNADHLRHVVPRRTRELAIADRHLARDLTHRHITNRCGRTPMASL